MKFNVYESAVIINAALDDEQIELEISRIKETIQNNGGELRDFENWGRKRLTYMIQKSKIGYYAIFRFEAPATIVSKLERYYSLNENIIRYLTLKLSKDALEHIEKHKVSAPAEVEVPVEPAFIPEVEEPAIEDKAVEQ